MLSGAAVPAKQIWDFLGIHCDFDKADFSRVHFERKCDVFTGLAHVLRQQRVYGDGLSINIQTNYYETVVRAALTYGMKVVVWAEHMWRRIKIVQNRHLRAVLGLPATSSGALMRLFLGVFPVAVVIAKLCLTFYWDVFVGAANRWRDVLRWDYKQYVDKYVANDCETKGIVDQYLHPTRQYVICLRFLGMSDRYINTDKLPGTKRKWRATIRRAQRELHEKEVAECTAKHGKLLLALLRGGEQHRNRPRRKRKLYPGLLNEMTRLMGGVEANTINIKPVARMLFDCTRIDRDNEDHFD